MKPSSFPESNTTFVAKGCGGLPAQDDGEQILTLWRMSWRERIAGLFYGKVWLSFGNTPPPVWLSCEKDVHVAGDEPQLPHPR